MHVELFVLGDVVADAVEEDEGEVFLALGGLGGGEETGGFVAGVWRPGVGTGEEEDFFPVLEGGDDFEGFGELAGFVAGEEEADPGGVSILIQ